jgi:signal transduction histidine kinase
LENWEHHPRAGDLSLEVEPIAGPWINAHSALLGQIVDNLLDNAAKYSPPGTPIAVRVEQCDQIVQLSVADTGCGIPRGDLRRLFEPFYRGSSPPKSDQPGVGLGLAVVHKAVKALDAAIVVRSEVGQGTQFTVNFAAAPTATEPVSTAVASEVA